MDDLLLARLLDWACMALMVVLPIVFVVLFNRLGILLGALAVWGIGYASGVILSGLDPARETPMLDTLWILGGWVLGLGYAVVLWALKSAFFARKPGHASHRPLMAPDRHDKPAAGGM